MNRYELLKELSKHTDKQTLDRMIKEKWTNTQLERLLAFYKI